MSQNPRINKNATEIKRQLTEFAYSICMFNLIKLFVCMNEDGSGVKKTELKKLYSKSTW